MRKKIIIFGALAVVALLVWIFLTYKPVSNGGPDKVSVRLDWLPQAQFAGVYVAQEKGYFKEESLDVTINPGGVNFNPIQLVASGSDTFGMANADQILVARSKGLPLVGVAALFQQNPSVFIAKKTSGITKPQDFVGKRVGVKYGTSPDILYRAMMNKLKIDMSKIQEIPVQFDMSQFFTGQVDVWPGYIINEALVAKEKGEDINIINPFDYGVYDYADVIFVTDSLLKEKPDVVGRFVRAILKGWQYSVQHPEEAVDILMKRTDGLDKAHETGMMQAVIPLMTANVNNKLGWMEPKKWEETYGFMLEQKQIDKQFSVTDAYTMRFVEEIYK